MTAVSDVSIANRALTKLGARRIASFDDDSKESRAVKAAYESVRDAELRRHLWNFAITRVSLAALVATPAFGFGYQYQLPADCLRVVMVGDVYPGGISEYRNADTSEWKVEGRRILTNYAAPLHVKYVARIEDPTLYDAHFVEAFACKLAAELCEDLTQNATKRQLAEAGYKETVKDARALDALEDPPQNIPDDSWILGRR